MDVSIEIESLQEGVVFTWNLPGYSDLVTLNPTVSCNYPETGSMFSLGSTEVRCHAEDVAGNQNLSADDCVFNVLVYGKKEK